MTFSYTSKMLWVDPCSQEHRDEALSEELTRKYLGGYGLGCKVLFDRQPAGVDALGSPHVDVLLEFLNAVTGWDATLDNGPLAGVTIDQKLINREFLEAMDWSSASAQPSAETCRFGPG